MMKFVQYLYSIAFVLLSLLISSNAMAQGEIRCRHYQNMQGLSHNTVMSLFQDSRGFMWIGTKNGLNRFDGSEFRVFMRGQNNRGLPNSIINSIAEDKDGNIWVATDEGIAVYHPDVNEFVVFNKATRNGEQIHDYVHSVDVDTEGNVWIMTSSDCFIYDRKDNLQDIRERVKAYGSTSPTLISKGYSGNIYISYACKGIVAYDPKHMNYRKIAKIDFSPNVVAEYDDNNILVGTNSGLYIINRLSGECTELQLDPLYNNNFVRSIVKTTSGTFWVGTENGVYVLSGKKIQHLTHNLYLKSYLSDNAVYSILEDRDGGMWIGTYFGGVDYLPRQNSFFSSYLPEYGHNSISGSRVRAFAIDNSGNTWIGTEDGGLDKRLPTGEFVHVTQLAQEPIDKINIQCLRIIDNKLWIGTFTTGIYCYDLQKKNCAHYTSPNYPLPNNDIFAIYADSDGGIWIGTSGGLCRFDSQTSTFLPIKSFNSFFVSDICQDNHGNLWVTTYNKGVVRFNYKRGDFRLFRYSPNNPTSLCFNRITCVFLDSKNRIWFASEDGGMCLYNERTETFERFDISNGLPSNSIYCIQEDNNQLLWLATGNGIATFNPSTKKVTSLFGVYNGLPTRQFNYNAGIRNSDGNILFGSINGYVEFTPDSLYVSKQHKQVALTGFAITSGKSDKVPAIDPNVGYVDIIRLSHDQNTFSISFSTLDYANEGKGMYAYKLEGFDKQWNYLSYGNKVSYHNIPAGNYLFKVRYVSGLDDNKDSEATTLKIIVRPPFWRSWWAYSLYIILITIFGIIFWKRLSRKRQERMLQRQKQQEKEQQERLYQEKINFFISIAHEVRTPVTLIKAPLEQLQKGCSSQKEIDENLSIISRNTERLQNLINQLLDFRKVEAESFQLHMKVVNVGELLKSVLERFTPTATLKNMKVECSIPTEQIMARVDEEALIKIISNLFNNAIKYGKTYIKVKLDYNSTARLFRITVSNDGELIPADMRSKVFEAFVQVDRPAQVTQGTGLGLALTKSLVDLHSGTITIDANANDNTFVVEIPDNMNEETERVETTSSIATIEEPTPTTTLLPEKTHTILVAEDDPDLRSYLAKQLGKRYKVVAVDNGRKALETVKNQDVSLIVSDVVMPEMTGLELCSIIKSDVANSDIPIILLTAKATLTDKIEGLEKGADAYIEKPFSMSHLTAQIDSLMDNRLKTLQSFAADPLPAYADIKGDESERKFMKNVIQIILNNLTDESFNVDTMADLMNMSRSSLHRKIKNISGHTPNELMRIVRMNKAAELLASGNYRINEVCEKIGIQSLSYFSKTFQKQFGVLPKDYVKS